MNATLGDRLQRLEAELTRPGFLRSEGLGNELGFHIFDYDPQHQPTVEAHLPRLIDRLARHTPPIRVIEINLYRLIHQILGERNHLARSMQVEIERGPERLAEVLKGPLRPEILVERVQANLAQPHELVFLSGVGAAWPLVRSHSLLNNLHPVVDRVPLVMFFPGQYTGQNLVLFGQINDGNYYRAFPLVPRRFLTES